MEKITTVRSKETFISKQQLSNFEGISAQTAGTFVPSAVALLTVRHASRNCRKTYLISDTEQVITVVSRNDANEQESVVVYKP